MRLRMALALSDLNAAWASSPSKVRPPRVGSYKPTNKRATVLLPQPDSPTKASVLPRSISKLTPSTAFSSWRGLRSITRLSQGAETSKVLAKSCATTKGCWFEEALCWLIAPPPRSLRFATSTQHASDHCGRTCSLESTQAFLVCTDQKLGGNEG